MNIFDIPWQGCPADAEYYFNVVVLNIAVRESPQNDPDNFIDEIWDIEKITSPRPFVVHIYTEDDGEFEDDENYFMEVYTHCAIEVSPTLGISFFSMMDEDEYDKEDEEEGTVYEIDDPDDLWRLD